MPGLLRPESLGQLDTGFSDHSQLQQQQQQQKSGAPMQGPNPTRQLPKQLPGILRDANQRSRNARGSKVRGSAHGPVGGSLGGGHAQSGDRSGDGGASPWATTPPNSDAHPSSAASTAAAAQNGDASGGTHFLGGDGATWRNLQAPTNEAHPTSPHRVGATHRAGSFPALTDLASQARAGSFSSGEGRIEMLRTTSEQLDMHRAHTPQPPAVSRGAAAAAAATAAPRVGALPAAPQAPLDSAAGRSSQLANGAGIFVQQGPGGSTRGVPFKTPDKSQVCSQRAPSCLAIAWMAHATCAWSSNADKH